MEQNDAHSEMSLQELGDLARKNADEIKALIEANLESGWFGGANPNLKKIRDFVANEVKKRKIDGRLPQTANITFVYDRNGKVVGRRIDFAPDN